MSQFTNKKYHFIGAGGIGMSGLAKVLVKNGAFVTGSDQVDTDVTENLRCIGADVHIGHSVENMQLPVEAVVISAAIEPDNPELSLARESDCVVYKYAEMLGELMDMYKGVAVCGTHGKSTTSAWLSYVLIQTGAAPSFIVGADIPQLGGSSGVGNGNGNGNGFFVAEACEYDRSFLNLRPQIAVMLNIEQDHLDYYKDEDDIVDAFTEFAACVRPDGLLIANGTDANVLKVIERIDRQRQVCTFGLDGDFDFSARNLELVNGLYRFDVYHHDQLLGKANISLPGRHNVLNALAVIAAAVNAGAEPATVLEALGGFTGIDRRLMLKAQIDGITILDDYAHHPTEIRASLSAIRQRYAPERIFCVFQPHQYSRTRFLLDDFAESFKLADITVVPEIYFVRDTLDSKKTVNAQVLVDRINAQASKAVFIETFEEICEYLKSNVRDGDMVVTMGAGDIWKVADEYIQWLRRNS